MTFSSSSSAFRYLHEHNISPSLFCPICLDVLQDPYIHLNCDSAFCQTCLLQLDKPVCPICRTYWGDFLLWPNNRYVIKANRLIRNMLDELLVECHQCQIVRRRGDFQHNCQQEIIEEEKNERKISIGQTNDFFSTFFSTSILVVLFGLIIYFRRWIFLETFDRRSTIINDRAVNLDRYLFNCVVYLIRKWLERIGSMLILSVILWLSLRWFEYRCQLPRTNKCVNRCLEFVIIVQLITYSIYH